VDKFPRGRIVRTRRKSPSGEVLPEQSDEDAARFRDVQREENRHGATIGASWTTFVIAVLTAVTVYTPQIVDALIKRFLP
jgi:hypothetical protein